MSEPVTPAAAPSTPVAAPAPAGATPAAPAAASPAAPLSLEQRRDALRAKPAPKPVEKLPEVVAAPVVEKKPEPAAKVDDDLAVLVNLDREVKAGHKKLETDRAALDARAKQIADIEAAQAKAKDLLKKGDKIAAIQALLPDEDLTTDVVWDLLKKGGEPGDAVDAEKLKAEIRAELKAEQDAAAKRAADEKTAADMAREKETEQRRTSYLEQAATHYSENEKTFPAMQRLGKMIGDEEAGSAIGRKLVKAHDEHLAKTGKPLTAAEALAEVEKQLKAAEPEPAAGEPPAVTPSSAYRSDPGHPAAPAKAKTVADRRAELARSEA